MDIQTQPHSAVKRLAFLYEDEDGYKLPARIALKLADTAGTTKMFYGLVFWQVGWMLLATLDVPFFGHDKYPYIFLLFLGNLIQLWYLPLLQIQQKRDAEVAKAKAEADHFALTHIANVVDLIADHLDIEAPKQPLPPISNPNYRMGSLGLGWGDQDSAGYDDLLDAMARDDENVADF